MNAERLHAVARRVRDDLAATDLPGLMQRLAEALANMASAPQDPTHQSTVSTLRSELAAALTSSVVNTFSPLERQVIDEWGVAELLGAELLATVEQIFQANQITAQTAQEQIAELVTPLQALKAQLDQLTAAMAGLSVVSEELAPGEFEIDVLLPRAAVRNELGALGVELKELDDILQPLIELATGSRPGIEIRSIGSTDFTIFLAALPAAAVCIAKAVDEVLKVYERILSIRRVKAELESLELEDGEDAIEQASLPLETYATSAMEKGVTEVATALVAEFASDRLPEGRSHELEVAVTRSLRAIAGRIDDGYNIAVRVGALPVADEEEEEAIDDQSAAARRELEEQVQAVEERTRSLNFMNLSGSRILSLDPSVNAAEDTATPDT